MSVIDAVRRPEYTGENRCWPCTALNLALVGAAAGVAVALWPLSVAVAVLALGTATVALRGYVVPYTPTYAPRVADALPVSFGSTSESEAESDRAAPPERADDLGSVDGDGRRVMTALFAADALRESGDDLRLADGVREARAAEMAHLRDAADDALAAAVADAAPFPATARAEHGGVTVEREAADAPDASEVDRTVWLTRALAIADAAAVRALRDAGVDADAAARAATPLRTLLEACPLCGGRVVETTYTACCGGSGSIYQTPGTPVLACDDCGEVVYRLDE